MRKIILLTLFIFISFGANVPRATKEDKRIQVAEFNANEVYEIRAKAGYISMIKFDNDERVVNIVCGFLEGWSIKSESNFVFIKPKSYQVKEDEQDSNELNAINQNIIIQPNPSDWKTNLIITTNKRIYTFDLILNVKALSSYRVDFLYTKEKNYKKYLLAKQKEKENLEKEEQENIEKELASISIPKNYNFIQHINKNSEDISVDYAYDDGIFTYLAFNTNKTIPSAFEYDKKNKESILNTHISKDNNYTVLVIHKVPKQILLRSGDKLVGIKNLGAGKNIYPYQETKSPEVERTINE